ncbi:hypothetical protein [Actinokineospora enzanensis]|uniref:hypothetical protein n=1 Tax=Actinokineospora enzanensis TaxID=155975 RepID=UPI00037229F4|nr:hypothetical protein [Actinokineospora enzanensis]
MSDLVISIVLCVAVAVIYAFAALIQSRHGHRTVRELTRMPVWWVAQVLNAAGAALHVWSLGFGPLSLIQPLGVLTLVIAVPLAAASARRRVTAQELVGMGATVVGLAGLTMIIATAGHADTLTSDELTWLLVAGGAVLVALIVRGHRPGASALWEATAGGLAYSVCSALCQTVVLHVDQEGAGVLLRPDTIVAMVAIVALAITATVVTQRSYRDGLGAPLAVTNLVNPASATAIGVLFLGESLAATQLQVVLALACAATAAFGVTQLARARDAERAPVLAAVH